MGERFAGRERTMEFRRDRFDYFRDRVPAFEAFKATQLDYWPEYSAKTWAMAYDFDAVKRGWVKREQFPVSTVAPMQAFAFNIRRPQFQDARVRRAFNLAFDFEWSNKNLFYDQYARVGSYFDNSELKAIGLPNGRELEMRMSSKTRCPLRFLQPSGRTLSMPRLGMLASISARPQTCWRKPAGRRRTAS